MANVRALSVPAVIDTKVIDDPDAAPHKRLFPTSPPPLTTAAKLPAIAIPRVSTEELAMHVMLDDGCFHRRIPSLSHSACEQEIHSQFAPPREGPRKDELRHPLCRRGCFTAFEIRIADELEAAERAAALNPPPPKPKKGQR